MFYVTERNCGEFKYCVRSFTTGELVALFRDRKGADLFVIAADDYCNS